MEIKGFKKIAKKYDLDLLIMFGSQAKGKINELSDLDLAFYRGRNFRPQEENALWEDIMHVLRRSDIDLINIRNTHNALLRYEIFMNGKLIFEKKRRIFAEMKWQAYIDFEDFKRFYQEKNRLLDQQLYGSAFKF